MTGRMTGRMTGDTSIGAALDAVALTLGQAGVPEPRREARILLGHALGVGRDILFGHPERTLTGRQHHALAGLVARRSGREPTAYLLGTREFWSLDFLVTRDTLIPRPDSETVIEAALAEVADAALPLRVLDFGTGSGCLLLALLSELPNATGLGVDIGEAALAVARANAVRLGLASRARFLRGDWGCALAGAFDLIVANPPYVGRAEYEDLAPEIVCYEPRGALDGGREAISKFTELLPDIARLLAPSGVAAVELGAGQGPAVAAIASKFGLAEAGRRRDLAGIDRCAIFRRKDGEY